jgi:hypothetical protein
MPQYRIAGLAPAKLKIAIYPQAARSEIQNGTKVASLTPNYSFHALLQPPRLHRARLTA